VTDNPDAETSLDEQSDTVIPQPENNPDPETSLDEQSDTVIPQPENNPDPETSLEIKPSDDKKNE
jgi:hypothetical protein